MSKAWHEIALCAGVVAPGEVGFHVNYELPDATSAEEPTDRQIDAVEMFYGRKFPDLTRDQAHLLLCVREYARLCADVLFKGYRRPIKIALAQCLAAFALSDVEMRQYAVKWSEIGFERGYTTRRVRGSPFFLDLKAFADYLEGSLEMNGVSGR